MNRLFRNVTYVSVTNFVKGLLGLVSVPVAIHSLGINGYGLFSIYLILVGYNQFFEMGISKNLSRLLISSSSMEEKVAHLKVALGLFSFIAVSIILLSPVIVYLVLHYLFPMPGQESLILKNIVILSIVDYLLSIPSNLRQIYCVSKEDFSAYSKFSLCSGLYRYALMFVGFVLFHSPDLVIAFTIIFRILDMFFGYVIMGALPSGSWTPDFNKRKIFNMLAHSGVLSGSQILQNLLITITPVLTNYFFGLRGMGIYQAAFNIANKIWFFSNSFCFVIFPRFVKFINKASLRKQQDVLSAILKLNWLIYCTIGATAICFTPLIMKVLHIDLLDNDTLLMFLFLALSVNAHSDIAYNYLLSKAKYAQALFLSFFALLLITSGFFIFKGQFGLVGTGIAWLVSQVIYSLCIDTVAISKLLQKDIIFKVAVLVCSIIVLLSGIGFLPMAIKYVVMFVVLIWLCIYWFFNKKLIIQILL